VPRFEDDTHAALAQTLFELIASVKDRLSLNRQGRLYTVIRTVIDVVRETKATGWALFHSLSSATTWFGYYIDPARVKTFTKRILAAAEQASKHVTLYHEPASLRFSILRRAFA
jgi:hypothetical protein